MNLLRGALAQRLGTVPLDLALGDGPRLADEPRLEQERDHLAAITADRDQIQASLAATRGVVTKMRKRVVAGACPFGCRRHFAELARHVATKHEGKALEAETA